MSDTPDILQRIVARKAEEIAERAQWLSLRELRQFLRKGGQQFGQRLGHAQGFLACRHF